MDGPQIYLCCLFAETRLQEDRPEGRAADPGGGPADREPERPMTISQPQFKPPLAKMRKEEEGKEEADLRQVGPKSRTELFFTTGFKGMKVAEFIHFGDFLESRSFYLQI